MPDDVSGYNVESIIRACLEYPDSRRSRDEAYAIHEALEREGFIASPCVENGKCVRETFSGPDDKVITREEFDCLTMAAVIYLQAFPDSQLLTLGEAMNLTRLRDVLAKYGVPY